MPERKKNSSTNRDQDLQKIIENQALIIERLLVQIKGCASENDGIVSSLDAKFIESFLQQLQEIIHDEYVESLEKRIEQLSAELELLKEGASGEVYRLVIDGKTEYFLTVGNHTLSDRIKSWKLYPQHFTFLLLLVRNAGTFIPFQTIAQFVWSDPIYDEDTHDRNIWVLASRLRTFLKDIHPPLAECVASTREKCYWWCGVVEKIETERQRQ